MSGRIDAMAAHTKLSLKRDVEDMAPKFGLSPGAESRFARVPLALEQSGVSYFKLAPGFRFPFGHRIHAFMPAGLRPKWLPRDRHAAHMLVQRRQKPQTFVQKCEMFGCGNVAVEENPGVRR